MINTQLIAESAQAAVKQINLNTINELDASAIQSHQFRFRRDNSLNCHGYSSWMNGVMEDLNDPSFCFNIHFSTVNLNNFSSNTASYRGSIRVNDNWTGFLDEMAKRRVEWLRKGKPTKVRAL